MAGLVDREVEGTCGEEGCWRIKSAVIEEGVNGEG
jgi:hypothetical protein